MLRNINIKTMSSFPTDRWQERWFQWWRWKYCSQLARVQGNQSDTHSLWTGEWLAQLSEGQSSNIVHISEWLIYFGDFPHGPVAKTPGCQCRGPGFDPYQGTRSHVMQWRLKIWSALLRLLCLWDFPGKNTGVGCHSLLQGIFSTHGSNPSLLHHRQILYHLTTREALLRPSAAK